MKIGVVYWHPGDGYCEIISKLLAEQGHDVLKLMWNLILPRDLSVVFIVGPAAECSIWPVAWQLLALPVAERPILVYWQHEGLPNPVLPEWFVRPVACARAWIRRAVERTGLIQVQPFGLLTRRLTRLRYYGDLHALRASDLLDVFVVTSNWLVEYLTLRGFSPMVAPLHLDWGRDLGLQRDIPVLWLGDPGTRQRRRILDRVRSDLRTHGVEMMWVDNVEHPAVYGEARTELLNRTKIVLNVPRKSWDDNTMRPLMGIMNGALIISLPMLPHVPLVPGKHVVYATPDQMAEVICYYLEHEGERRRIAEAAYHLVTTELAMAHSIERIMTRVAQVREQRVLAQVDKVLARG